MQKPASTTMLEEPCAQSLSMQSEQVSLLHDLCECFFARGRGHTCPPHCEAKKDIARIADDNRQHRISRSSGHVCHVLHRKSPRWYHSKKKSPIATVQQNDKPRRGMLVWSSRLAVFVSPIRNANLPKPARYTAFGYAWCSRTP